MPVGDDVVAWLLSLVPWGVTVTPRKREPSLNFVDDDYLGMLRVGREFLEPGQGDAGGKRRTACDGRHLSW